MKTIKTLILSFFAVLLLSNTANASTIDSVGTEIIDGKIVILHKVMPKETLYSIKTKYKVSISEITALNPGSEMGLQIGQILKISTPIVNELTTEVVEIETPELEKVIVTEKVKKYHTVKPGETLYGISRMYPCSVNDIKKWNNLVSNALSVGKSLQISESEKKDEITENVITEIKEEKIETEEIIIEKTEAVVEEEITVEETQVVEEETVEIEEETEIEEEITVEETQAIEEEVKIEETIIEEEIIEEKVEEEKVVIEEESEGVEKVENVINDSQNPEEAKIEIITTNVKSSDSIPSTKTVDMGGYSKIYEKGFADLIKGTENDSRYLAHHRTLPEGTILQVKNLSNGKSVFVRIIGSFENEDSKIIIQLSQKAETRLQTESAKFLTEISYIP